MNIVRGWIGSCWLVVALTFLACGTHDDPADGGTDGAIDSGENKCQVDNSQMRPAQDADWELTAGVDGVTGFICPKGDIDHYWFTVANPGTLLTVHLSNNIQMSPVDLCYTIFPPGNGTGLLGGKCDNDGMDGFTRIDGSHYLETAGTYYLEVRDESSDEADDSNAYLISLEEMTDPDTYEPNNNKSQAKPVGAAKGYISYLDDQDWYAIEVSSAGQILSIDLSTGNPTVVDLEYTLYQPDGVTPVNTGHDDNGIDSATHLTDVLPVHQPGTYYLVVEDLGDDDNETEVGYSLQVTLRNDPDSRDQAADNGSWDHATMLTSGSPVNDGYIASRADEDWYRIEKAGVSDHSPALLEIELEFLGNTPVNPAIDLFVKDPNTPCVDGDACTHLAKTCGGGWCEDNDACRDAECPSHECDFLEGQCRGAGFCLNGGCAIRHLFLEGVDWSRTGDATHLHTVAPMYGDIYYVLVRDFRADDADPDTAYRLTVTARDEPDTHEFPPNGIFLPYATNEQELAARRWNDGVATDASGLCSDDGNAIVCGPITGYLSFRGDQDWYKLAIPQEDEPVPEAQSTKQDYDIRYEWTFDGNPKLEINYMLTQGDTTNWPHSGICATPGPSAHGSCWTNTTGGVFGDANDPCLYVCGEYHGRRPFYLGVMHYDRKEYDYSVPYQITIRAIRDCPQDSCAEYCGPGVDAYACPNPVNPDPAGYSP